MGFGKETKRIEKEVEIEGRIIVVCYREYESGLHRINARFLDMSKSWLTQRNMELTKRVRELEEQIKNAK